MIYIGDYFALGLVCVLCIFYLDGKIGSRHLSVATKCFIAALVLTALTALTDLCSVYFLTLNGIPLWLNIAVNTLYFLVNIITTSSIALFLFIKILEHAHDNHCMKKAKCGLVILFALYSVLVAANLWTGWLFYFDDAGNYCRGPLNAVGYVCTILQMVLVLICFFRNRKNANRSMRRALLQTFPVIIMCIIIQRVYPEVMLNAFVMAMMCTVLFLSFQGQQQGVHALTKLNDRHRFFKELDSRITKNEKFQVFLINIKNFGIINQKYGHLFGDEFLYHFAFALEKLIKNSAAFHMNGTVFSLILPYVDQTTAEKQAGTLLDFLERGITCLNKHVSMEYVVVEYAATEPVTSASEFYEKLEYAASRAYQQKNRYIRYTAQMGAEMNRTRYLMDRIRTVDRAHGFEVWYQPMQCMHNGDFCSMEALVRLRESDGSLISPAEFIPLAEQMGWIAPITWFVLEEVCDMLRRNPILNGITVSVNLPMPQLLDKGFVPRLNSIVDQAGIPRQSISIEFTERAILENFQRTQGIMEELTRDGYHFLLDDFGTGYSNFNCLLQLPFQFIKLDSCLIRPGADNSTNYSTVQTLTNLFHDMQLRVIAEGVETDEAVETLRQFGIDRIQGFALARPMPEKELLAFIREHQQPDT